MDKKRRKKLSTIFQQFFQQLRLLSNKEIWSFPHFPQLNKSQDNK